MKRVILEDGTQLEKKTKGRSRDFNTVWKSGDETLCVFGKDGNENPRLLSMAPQVMGTLLLGQERSYVKTRNAEGQVRMIYVM